MKRLMALVLAMLLLCAGMAQAAEWRDGLGPNKPYEGVAEVDLSAKMGYMMFYPNETLGAETVCQRLYVYVPREDVVAGDGTFYVCNEKDGEVWSAVMNASVAITMREINEAELEGLLWGGGTCFEIVLPKTLELGKNYFVNMGEGCIVTEDGSVRSEEVGGTDVWAFSVTGDYGVGGMEYRRNDETVMLVQAGDSIRFDLTLGGAAVSAALYGVDDSVDFPLTMFSESCEVTGTVLKNAPAWGVAFLDATGNIIDRVNFG